MQDLSQWVRTFRDLDIPVLSHSAQQLEGLRARQDAVDANLLGDAFAGDPLMTLKILAYASTHRSPRLITETETLTATLVMMGVGPFFRAFCTQTTVQERLASQPQALDGLLSAIHRSHRASVLALGFAVHRRDGDATVIHLAALLHDLAELLLWCHRPDLALQLQRLQMQDATLRSVAVQRAVLNIELTELQQALMKAWRLPNLLVRISDDAHADHPSVRCVLLGVRLARHSALGWENPALPDDLLEISRLLNMSTEATYRFVREIVR